MTGEAAETAEGPRRVGPGDLRLAAGGPSGGATASPVSFGGLLRAHRQGALLSQEELAQRAGLSVRTVRELEAGRVRRPRGASVRLLAQALELQGRQRQAFAAAAQPGPGPPPGGLAAGVGAPGVLVVVVGRERCPVCGSREAG